MSPARGTPNTSARAEPGLEGLDLGLGAAGALEVFDGALSSTGKKPMVAPYSGAMLPMVARSGTLRLAVPSPKNSTNLPTTLLLAQALGHRQRQVGGGAALAQRPVVQSPPRRA